MRARVLLKLSAWFESLARWLRAKAAPPITADPKE